MRTKYTPAELVAVGHALQVLLGRVPSRDDLRGENKKELEDSLGAKLPSEKTFAAPFGSWSDYLRACGWGEPGGSELTRIERAAVSHCVEKLQVTEEQADRSITDGWMPDGRTVEIKGSVLRQHKTNGYYFFAFATHGRELSKSADLLVLVGLDKNLAPIMRAEIPKSAMPTLVDGKAHVLIYAGAAWGTGSSQYRRYIRWIRPGTMQQVPEWGVSRDGSGNLTPKR